jgi:hypothetical protein
MDELAQSLGADAEGVAPVAAPSDSFAAIRGMRDTIDRELVVPMGGMEHLFAPYLALLHDSPNCAEVILQDVAIVARAAIYASHLKNPRADVDFDPYFRAVMSRPLRRILDGTRKFSEESLAASRIGWQPDGDGDDGYFVTPNMHQLVELLVWTGMFEADGLVQNDTDRIYHFTDDVQPLLLPLLLLLRSLPARAAYCVWESDGTVAYFNLETYQYLVRPRKPKIFIAHTSVVSTAAFLWGKRDETYTLVDQFAPEGEA